MISDTISLFNCNTRIKYNDYSYFLGNDAIYNESAFLHFKIFDDSIKRLIRKNIGDEDFNKVKNDNKQKTSESIFRDNQYEKQLESISFNNKKLISFHKKKKARRLNEYLGREITEIFDDNDSSEDEKNDNLKNEIPKFEEAKNYDKINKPVSKKKKKEKKGVDLLGLDMSVCNSDDDTYQKQKKSLRNSNLLGNDYSNINIDELTNNLIDVNKANNIQKNNNSIKGIDLGLDVNTIKSINSNMKNYNTIDTELNFKLKNNPYEGNNKKPISSQNVFDFFVKYDNNKNINNESHKYYAKSPEHGKHVIKNNTNNIFGNNFFSPIPRDNNNKLIIQHFKKDDNPIVLQSNTMQINNNMPHFDLTKSNNSSNNISNNNNSFKNLPVPNNQINHNNNISQQGNNIMLSQSNNNYNQTIDFSQDYQKSNELALKIPVIGETSLNNNKNNNFNINNMINTNVNNINNTRINNNMNNINNNLNNNNRMNYQKNQNNLNNRRMSSEINNIINIKFSNLNNNMNNNRMNKQNNSLNINIMNNSNKNINNNIINKQNNNINNNIMNNSSNNINNNIMNNSSNNINNNIMNKQNNNINNNIMNISNNNMNNNNNFISNNIPSASIISNMTTSIYNMQNNNNLNNQNNSNLNNIPLSQKMYNLNNSSNTFNQTINNNISFVHNFSNSSQTISTIKRIETNNSVFSQDDMSFLSLNKNVKNQKEDYLRISKKNPEIFGELKEKIYYYMQNNNQIKNVISKGYIGLMIVPKFHINKKTFSLIEIQPQWKDNNIYQNKEFNPNLIKTTETTYKIDIFNSTNAIKFLTYSINQNALNKNHIILPNFNINNNLLIISISYLDNSFKNSIYKVEIEIILKKGNLINSNGKISKGNDNLFIITYPNCINESKIQFDNFIGNLNNYFKRITIRFEMKGKLRSNNEIKITYNNTNSETEELIIQKLTLLSYEYEF